jgi:hypothetical protein
MREQATHFYCIFLVAFGKATSQPRNQKQSEGLPSTRFADLTGRMLLRQLRKKRKQGRGGLVNWVK